MYDVIIVGCGPVGATLANLLRVNGHKVAVIERDKAVYPAPRAMVMDAEATRLYQRMGYLPKLLEKDASPFRIHKFQKPNRDLLLKLNFDEVEDQFGQPAAGLMFHQPALEQMLRDDFAKDDCVDFLEGVEVVGIESAEDEAWVDTKNVDTGEEQRIHGRYIVGSDGGASMCRRWMKPTRMDFNYSRKWIVMDIIVQDDDVWNSFDEGSEFRCRTNASVVFVKGHHNHCRIDFECGEERANSFTEDDARELLKDYFDPSLAKFIRLAPYDFYAGMPDRWRVGRVLLAGDAAHQTSPFSGQGLNMGIRDAAHLGFLFDLVLKGHASDRVLDTYQGERWEHCKFVTEGASKRGRLISTKGVVTKLRDVGFGVANSSRLVRKLLFKDMFYYPAYKGGLIVEGHKLSGHRLIQPEVTKDGETKLLDDVIGDGYVLLLPQRENNADALQWFTDMGGQQFVVNEDFQDHTGKLNAFMKGAAVLVRPDRFITAAGPTGVATAEAFRLKLASYQ